MTCPMITCRTSSLATTRSLSIILSIIKNISKNCIFPPFLIVILRFKLLEDVDEKNAQSLNYALGLIEEIYYNVRSALRLAVSIDQLIKYEIV